MTLHIGRETIHCNEMNDQIFEVVMNVWDIAGNVIEPMSLHQFRPFYRENDLMAYVS
jgi:hypothetical protein